MKLKYVPLLALATSLFVACENAPKKTAESTETTTEASTNEWQNLIQNDSFEGWHYYQNDDSKKGWSIADGVLTFNSELAEGKGDKSLLTDQEFENFEIMFEWKVSPGGNSGFMWGVNESELYEFPYETGPEIQVLDPEVYKGDEANQVHAAGALYDMIAPSQLVTKPAGEWNTYHITINQEANEGIVVHNDVEINRFPLYGPEWDAMVAKSKFADWEGFGKYRKGHLCIQDHPGIISYRNMKVRAL